MSGTKNQNKVLILLLSNLFIAFLGIGLVIPVMPTLMRELDLDGTIMGYLVSAFAVAQLIVSPFAGKWVDLYGRKRMIVIGMFIFGVSELIFGLGEQVWVLFVSRVLGGISAAFIMPAVTAFIADITTIKERPKALGYLSAAINTGFIIGPGIGGFLADIGTRVPFYFAGGLGIFAGFFSIVMLSEPERTVETNSSKMESDTGKKGYRKLFTIMYLIPFLIILSASLGLSTFESMYSLFVDQKYGFTAKDIAMLITVSAILGVIAQVFLFERITRIIGEIWLVKICLLVGAIFAFLLTRASAYWSVLAVTFLVFLAFDLIRPAITTYLSRIAGNDQGFVSGMNSAFTSIGNIIGPAIGGILFDVNLIYPYMFAAILLGVSLLISLVWRERETAEVQSIE